MSWYRDPKLFLRYRASIERFYIHRIMKKYNVPLYKEYFDTSEVLDFSRHLSLGHNQESNYDALKSWLKKITALLSILGTWSRVEENDSVFYSLPGIFSPYEIKLAEKRADERKISDLKDKLDYEVTKFNSEVTYLQEQLNQEKNDRQAQVSDLTTKLEECCDTGGRSADVQRWKSGDTASSQLVPLEGLDVIRFSNNTSLTSMEGSSSWSRVEEDDSIFYCLPGITNPSDTELAEKRAVEKKMSELVAQNSILKEKLKEQLNREKKISELLAEISSLKDKLNTEVTNLQEQLNREKNARQAQVSDLIAKLKDCRGVGSGAC
ncbi:hypothetical protein MKW92_009904 [Papaver armeniacum]|nr:hypothetical protein MKW92_009904 [Papaver armeniacum]